MWTKKLPLIDLVSHPSASLVPAWHHGSSQRGCGCTQVSIPKRGLSNPWDGAQWLCSPSIQGFGSWKGILHPMGEALAVPALVSVQNLLP